MHHYLRQLGVPSAGFKGVWGLEVKVKSIPTSFHSKAYMGYI